MDSKMIARHRFLTLFTGLAMAGLVCAQQGAPSASASAEISLRIPELVRLSGLSDISLQGSDAGFQGGNQLCVYRNNSAGQYSIIADSDNGAGAGFTLRNNDSAVAYQVLWNGETLSDGNNSGVFDGANHQSLSCNGEANAHLLVSVSDSALAEASQPGEHRDTLTLTVIAE